MPEFKPFIGTRYANDIDPELVISPPYDVVDAQERKELAGRHVANAIKIELPDATDNDITGINDNYEYAQKLIQKWLDDKIIVDDDKPCFYVYKMSFKVKSGTNSGSVISTTGVLGALRAEEPGAGDILPHENTIKKAKTDRLDLLRATKTNISPIWGLSLTVKLSEILELNTQPDIVARDDDDVLHELWVVDGAEKISQISEIINSKTILIADGHHRYETAWAYRNEIRNSNGNLPGDHDYVLAYVVELNQEQIHLQAIHRLISGPISIMDLVTAVGKHYEILKFEGLQEDLLETMHLNKQNAIYTNEGIWLIHPKDELIKQSESDLETKWLEVALNDIPQAEINYQHGLNNVINRVINDEALAAILLNPVSIEQIKASSQARFRMPPKSTFFTPKPRTGMVFRRMI